MTGEARGRVSRDGKIKVVFIAGAGRSGTTLLEVILGQLPGFFAAGEITHIWNRSYVQNQLCGCMQPFSQCPFWNRVTREAFGDWSSVKADELEVIRKRVCSLLKVPQIALPILRTRTFQRRYRQYAKHFVRLYDAIKKVSGCRVIIDSSKYPSELFFLKSLKEIDLSVVHLVRDSQAVVYAWQKWKVRPDVYWRLDYMPRHSMVKTAMAWNIYNEIIGRFEDGGIPYSLVRYEDLIRDPRATLIKLGGMLGCEKKNELQFIRGNEVTLSQNHTACGNSIRFARGRVPLQLDREWEEKTSRLRKELVCLLTRHHRRRYGYAGADIPDDRANRDMVSNGGGMEHPRGNDPGPRAAGCS